VDVYATDCLGFHLLDGPPNNEDLEARGRPPPPPLQWELDDNSPHDPDDNDNDNLFHDDDICDCDDCNNYDDPQGLDEARLTDFSCFSRRKFHCHLRRLVPWHFNAEEWDDWTDRLLQRLHEARADVSNHDSNEVGATISDIPDINLNLFVIQELLLRLIMTCPW
jgi:hypothetical protein